MMAMRSSRGIRAGEHVRAFKQTTRQEDLMDCMKRLWGRHGDSRKWPVDQPSHAARHSVFLRMPSTAQTERSADLSVVLEGG